jgi:hypothetical protein
MPVPSLPGGLEIGALRRRRTNAWGLSDPNHYWCVLNKILNSDPASGRNRFVHVLLHFAGLFALETLQIRDFFGTAGALPMPHRPKRGQVASGESPVCLFGTRDKTAA